MRATIDFDKKEFIIEEDGEHSVHDLFSKEAFSHLNRAWVQLGWVQKYSYGFSWMGRPIIQLPDDMARIQEVIYSTKPDVIIETGVAHGGSLIYYASLFEAAGAGRVIGIDIEIRPHNRAAIEAHEMAHRITLIEGSSIEQATVDQVAALIKPDERVMLILDSNHLRDHVAAELELYSGFVTPGCYILSQDGVMQMVAGMPRTSATWDQDNPISAVEAFLDTHGDTFELVTPPRPFDETQSTPDASHHPSGWLLRR